MLKALILIILLCLISPVQALSADPGQSPLTPLPEVTLNQIRTGEGKPYCYAGYGTQQMSFKIGGSSVHSDDTPNPYIPKFDPTLTTFLRFGCKTDFLFMDFSTVTDSIRMNNEVTYEGIMYNSIQFKYSVVAIGHSLSLIPHRLYLDLGLGYSMLEYNLGLYGSQYSSQYTSDTIESSGQLLRTSVRVIINHYVMIHWQHEKSINKEAVVDYSGQLGLNFIARF